jgi:hypothetical protein
VALCGRGITPELRLLLEENLLTTKRPMVAQPSGTTKT